MWLNYKTFRKTLTHKMLAFSENNENYKRITHFNLNCGKESYKKALDTHIKQTLIRQNENKTISRINETKFKIEKEKEFFTELSKTYTAKVYHSGKNKAGKEYCEIPKPLANIRFKIENEEILLTSILTIPKKIEMEFSDIDSSDSETEPLTEKETESFIKKIGQFVSAPQPPISPLPLSPKLYKKDSQPSTSSHITQQ